MATAVAVGVVGYDDVETPSGAYRHQLGGGATFFALAGARLAPTRLVAAVGTDFDDRDLLSLAEGGVDVTGVERIDGRSHRWAGRYGAEMGAAETLVNDVGVVGAWRPVVDGLRPGDVLYVGSLDPAIQAGVIDRTPRGVTTIFDTQDHWIARSAAAAMAACARCDVACLNEDEIRMLTGHGATGAAAARLLDAGVRAIVMKQGRGGATLFHSSGDLAVPAYPLERVEDPTGAGDALAGGLAGHLARTGRDDLDTLADAVAYGVACASFVAGRAAGRRIPDWSLEAIEARRRELRGAIAAPRP